MKCLIIYHSKYGQTEKISNRIAAHLEPHRFTVITYDISFLDQSMSFEDVDLVVIGAPIYAAKHSKRLARFIRKHHDELKNTVSAFFFVSLSAAGTASQKDDALHCAEEFLAQTDWIPDLQKTFAGSLPYLEYGWLTRFLMKWIVKKAGGDTDTTKNHEYTDWKRVDRFTNELVELCKSKQVNVDAASDSKSTASATSMQTLP